MLINKGETNATMRTVSIRLFDTTDGFSAKTGASGNPSISINGGAFASSTNAVSEVGNGVYRLVLDATEVDEAGTIDIYWAPTGGIAIERIQVKDWWLELLLKTEVSIRDDVHVNSVMANIMHDGLLNQSDGSEIGVDWDRSVMSLEALADYLIDQVAVPDDVKRIRQVLVNKLVNTVAAGDTSGSITYYNDAGNSAAFKHDVTTDNSNTTTRTYTSLDGQD